MRSELATELPAVPARRLRRLFRPSRTPSARVADGARSAMTDFPVARWWVTLPSRAGKVRSAHHLAGGPSHTGDGSQASVRRGNSVHIVCLCLQELGRELGGISPDCGALVAGA